MRKSPDLDLHTVFIDLDDTLSDELHHVRSVYAAALSGLPEPLGPGVAGAVLDAYMDIGIDLYRRNAWDELSREARVSAALRRVGVEPGICPRGSSTDTSRIIRKACACCPGRTACWRSPAVSGPA